MAAAACSTRWLTWWSSLSTLLWLRTNGVNTNGAAARVMNFDSLGRKVRPGTFGEIKAGPICPFPTPAQGRRALDDLRGGLAVAQAKQLCLGDFTS